MGVNHVQTADGETLIDLRGNTVTPEVLDEGYTATNAQGEQITGTKKQSGGGDNNTLTVELSIAFTASGAEVYLPEGVTYTSLCTAIDNNIHIICVMRIPDFAGAMAGIYVAPFTRKSADGSLYFSTTTDVALQYFKIATDGSVSYGIYDIENQDNKVTSLTPSVSHEQYPSAKAAYDLISRNSTIVVDVVGEFDEDGYLYLDEATELQIYQIAGTGQAAIIRYKVNEDSLSILLHHMGQGIFVSTLVTYNISVKLVYDRSKLALRAEMFAHTEAAASTYGARQQGPTFNDYMEALRQSAEERGLLNGGAE